MSKRCSAGPPGGPGGSPPEGGRGGGAPGAAVEAVLGRRAGRRALLWKALALLLPLPLLAFLAGRPDPGLQRAVRSLEGVVIADRQGRILDRIPGERGEFMQRLSRDELPPAARQIIVRLEDRRFYLHFGVDPAAVLRAALLNARRGRVVSGASTITMQVARILKPHPRSLAGKLGEALDALRLEAALSKEEILLLYANRLPFGYNVRGFAAAAVTYFDRPLGRLTRAQLLLLATIPRAPTLYDPFRRPQALGRRARLLARQVGVPEAEIGPALATVRRGRPVSPAPHFARWLRRELERDGWTAGGPARPRGGGEAAPFPGPASSLPPSGRLARVITTLDGDLDAFLAGRLQEALSRRAPAGGVRGGGPSGGVSPRGRTGPTNAAGLVIDNRTGEILAWAGSRDFFDGGRAGQVDGVLARHPAGSTLKPLLYGLALERGWTAASLLPDLRLDFGSAESYRPLNFDRRSRGPVRLRTALASSLNVPAVALLSRLGLERFLEVCRQAGIDLPPDAAARWGLGAAVGNVEVTLYELARAFSAFPRGGLLLPLKAVRELHTLDGGRYLPPQPPAGRRLFREETAWLVRDILSDAAARSSGFGTRSRLNTPFRAMFKSGTAGEYTSLWCLGATDEITVGVWAGNFDGRPSFGDTGSAIPARVAVEVLAERIRRAGSRPPAAPRPPGLGEARICALTGEAATPACPSTRMEFFLPGTEPREPCPVHTGRLSLEALAARVLLQGSSSPRILFPLDGSVFYRDPQVPARRQRIPVLIAGPGGQRLEIRFEGRLLPAAPPSGAPAAELPLPDRPGRYRLDVRGGGGADTVFFSVR